MEEEVYDGAHRVTQNGVTLVLTGTMITLHPKVPGAFVGTWINKVTGLIGDFQIHGGMGTVTPEDGFRITDYSITVSDKSGAVLLSYN